MLPPPDHLIGPDTPLGALIWRLPAASAALSSAAVGGGWSTPRWIVNLQVPRDYARTDVGDHVGTVARLAGLDGPGVGLLTAASVERYGAGEERGLRVDATAGIADPTWAAAPDEPQLSPARDEPAGPGTVNIVARFPDPLEPAAAVNAIATITEAKTQAFFERDIPGTGTPTDAITVVWPTHGERPIRFCGPRSPWGAAVARATHHAVGAAIDRIGAAA
ncbi:MAG: adenosylcobinamide amidohydrolase [Actinomycetota bacterium]